jgi:hypothetical protein
MKYLNNNQPSGGEQAEKSSLLSIGQCSGAIRLKMIDKIAPVISLPSDPFHLQPPLDQEIWTISVFNGVK